jgi:hypothetical protein
MPLLPFARPAIADRNMRAVRFTMKDGSRPVDILVSNPALESIDIVPIEHEDYFATFKIYRKSFERIASQKYDRGHVEVDGTVCIRALDVPLASVN